MNVAAIVGPSGAGKTTLLALLIRHFTGRGRSVAAVKHTHHALTSERRGDTEVFLLAGAMPAVLAGDGEAIVFTGDSVTRMTYDDPGNLIAHLGTDIVLVEGFKQRTDWPRIEINIASRPSLEEVLNILDRIWRS